MLVLTKTETRADINTPFYDPPVEYYIYLQKYNDIRRNELHGWTPSSDGLSRVAVTQFNTEQDYNIFLADSEVVACKEIIDEYNSCNNIITTIVLT